MDPALDPPPAVAAQPAAVIPPAAAAAAAAAPTASPVLIPAAAHNHPPYAEMISGAIAALKERDGSSKRAIAKYIETNYSDLPPTHSALLTHHLKRLKTNGQLIMVKHSYALPGLRSAPAVNGVESADPAASASAKRRPGRPPKPKPDSVHVAVPVFPPPINMNDVPPPFASDPPGNDAPAAYIAPANGARGRGRPPKLESAKRGRGRPPKSGSGGSGGRGRGRPKKNASPAPAAGAGAGRAGRPRGRPPKPINVVEGFAPVVPASGPMDAAPPAASGKRRGRPPKAGNEAKKARNMNATTTPRKQRILSGKPLGRPRKTDDEQAAVNRTPDSQLLVAYLDLKAKLENLQTMVKQAATLIRPSLNNETALNAMQELEFLAMNASVPPNAQAQQQPLPEQVQPQN